MMQVSPNVSRLANLSTTPSEFKPRVAALLELEPANGDVVPIDADQPLEEVLLQIKTHVWGLL